jgi:hypothetical protein
VVTVCSEVEYPNRGVSRCEQGNASAFGTLVLRVWCASLALAMRSSYKKLGRSP